MLPALTVEVVDVGGIDFTQVSLAMAGLAGDFDNDEDVDGADFLVWQQGFGGSFNASDLDDWQVNYGTSASLAATQAVPEPTTLALALLGALSLVRRANRIAN